MLELLDGKSGKQSLLERPDKGATPLPGVVLEHSGGVQLSV